MSTPSTNKEIVLTWFDALARGDADTAMALTHPEFRFFMPGTMAISGWSDLKGFHEMNVMLGALIDGAVVMRMGDIIAEGDRVFVETETDAKLKNGKTYANNYIMALRIEDGRVLELKEFSDLLHVRDVLDAPGTQISDKPRQRHLGQSFNKVTGTDLGAALRPC